MLRKKKQYLITGDSLPRRTEYRYRKILETRRRREAQLLAQCIYRSESSDDETHNACSPAIPEFSQPSPIVTSDSDVNTSPLENMSYSCASSDEEIEAEASSTKLRKINTEKNTQFMDSDETHQLEFSKENTGSREEKAEEEEFSDDRNGMGTKECQIEVNNSSLCTDETLTYNFSEYPLLSNKLCACSPATEGDALLLCLALGIRHNLNWVAMVDILKMINKLFRYEAISSSKYSFLKYMDIGKSSAKYHVYCSLCETYLGVKDDIENENALQCDCIQSDKMPTSYFISVDLADQFKSLLQRDGIANEILTYRFNRKKLNQDALEDIFDGEAYKELCENGQVLSDPCNFSYTFNTDGVQMGKSGTNAAWPIFISINELSPQNRKQNMVFAGLWVGAKQPNMRIFLKPFVDEANRLSTEGFDWTDSNNVQHHSRVIPLCCVVDSAARYKLLNLQCYSGYYGCTFCYQQAENTNKGRRFTIPKEAPLLRTHQSIIDDMKEAINNRNNPIKKKRTVKGCKGPSRLAFMKYLDLDRSFVVDSMHNSFLGMIKTHTGTLLQSYNFPFYIGAPENVSIINNRLRKICPPTCITRTPRSIAERKLWKASEWRSWLLFYSLVCLHGVLNPIYVTHLALFSTALYTLLQKSVPYTDIEIAHTNLVKYVFLIQEYFGKTAMLYNTHLLTHICRGVINYGPLWTHTAFQFEGENRHLMQMHTASGLVAKQLVTRYSIFSAFPTLCERYASSDTPIEFLNEITGKSLKSFVKCDNCCLLVGKGNPCSIDITEFLSSEHVGKVEVMSFQKMFYEGHRYCISSYADGKKNDDSYISLGSENKARIEHILQIKSQDHSTNVMILVSQLTLTSFLKGHDVTVLHIKEVIRTESLIAIKPSDILGQCIFMNLDHGMYVADIPYGCYGD